MNRRIICQRCVHYYVTWEKHKPHGCRAYGFKSQITPSIVVRQSSGDQCNFYEDKRASN